MFVFACSIASTLINTNIFAANCEPPSSSIDLDINNVRAKLLNGGDMFWDIFGNTSPAYEIPKNSGRHANFTSSLWLSGTDAGNNLHTAGQTYRQRGLDFWPGPLNSMGEIEAIDCNDWDEIFSVYGTEINNAKTGKSIAYNISRWPSEKAPFYDNNSDGIYDPSLGDYPVIDINHSSVVPGQLAYWVFNDKGNIHTAYPGSNPFGVEIQAFAYAFTSSTSDAIDNTTMFKYKITNKSNTPYATFRVGIFNDFDLGNANDDYVGCDLSTNSNGKKRNLFFVYNSDNDDEDGSSRGYGIAPPAFGITFLNPGKSSIGAILEMESHLFFTNQSVVGLNADPRDASELDRYMRGYWADGSILSYGTPDGRGGSDSTKFAFPGSTDPNGRPAWVETGVPGDRRSSASIKPRSLAPGEVMEIDFAFVWARDTPGTNLSSLEKLRLSTDTIITEFQTQFNNFSTNVRYQKENIRIYPNPSSSYLIIEGMGMISTIKIYDTQGKMVKQILKPSSSKISIDDLAQGTYYIKIDNYTHKFIKL